jgi:nicotinamide riboside transporter PnuC
VKAFGILHALVGRACDAVVAPLADANPWAALCAFSLLLALLSVLAFRVCGNQAALDRRRDRVVAHVLELRLYKDDLLSIFPIAGRVLAALPAYLASFALPVLVLLVPAVLLLTHAACWFEHRPLRPGEAALVAARSGA